MNLLKKWEFQLRPGKDGMLPGRLPAKRTLTGHRFYTEDDLLITQGLKPVESKRKVVVYCRPQKCYE